MRRNRIARELAGITDTVIPGGGAGYFRDRNGEADRPAHPASGCRSSTSMTGPMPSTLAVGPGSGGPPHGRGRDIDVSLFDRRGKWPTSTIWPASGTLSHHGPPYRPQRPSGDRPHPSPDPVPAFPDRPDGWIYIMANKEKFWPRLCQVLGRPDLADDPRFRTFADRPRPPVRRMEEQLERPRSPRATRRPRLAGKGTGGALCRRHPINTVHEALASRFVGSRIGPLVQTLER